MLHEHCPDAHMHSHDRRWCRHRARLLQLALVMKSVPPPVRSASPPLVNRDAPPSPLVDQSPTAGYHFQTAVSCTSLQPCFKDANHLVVRSPTSGPRGVPAHGALTPGRPHCWRRHSPRRRAVCRLAADPDRLVRRELGPLFDLRPQQQQQQGSSMSRPPPRRCHHVGAC